MSTSKKKTIIQASDDLAAIDEQLNAAIEHLDVTNTKVTEILSAVDITPGVTPPTPDEEAVDDLPAPTQSEAPRKQEPSKKASHNV